ncbi:conserved exported protein of unknown function [Cyanobium sp. NIES-981]|nr:conserved exported protein of unknown function [Cyanobium sp. NIES-981]
MLPLAATASMVLVLSSLSLQAMALQERSRLAALQRLRSQEDQLMSAAQLVTGRLQRRHRCLLALPASAWGQDASCSPAAALAELLEPATLPDPVRLLHYCPQPGEPPQATLVLELASTPTPRRASFRVALAPGERQDAPPRVVGLQDQGLLGGQALPAPCPEPAP